MNEKDVQKQFGLIVRELRKSKGMTQANLAGAIGFTDETISIIERGKASTKIKTAIKLAEVFDVELKDLFDFPPETPEAKRHHKAIKEFADTIAGCDDKTITAILKTAKIMAELRE